jgi:hypothetical protein
MNRLSTVTSTHIPIFIHVRTDYLLTVTSTHSPMLIHVWTDYQLTVTSTHSPIFVHVWTDYLQLQVHIVLYLYLVTVDNLFIHVQI